MTVHDRPMRRIDWAPFLRVASAFGGLAIIAFFVVEIVIAKHLVLSFKIGAIAVIAVIAVSGAMAILQREPEEPPADEQRLYTAEEVAALLNAVRANGGRFGEPATSKTATCVFCGKPDANVRGLDGTRYHRACFQRAYRAHNDDDSRRPTRIG